MELNGTGEIYVWTLIPQTPSVPVVLRAPEDRYKVTVGIKDPELPLRICRQNQLGGARQQT